MADWELEFNKSKQRFNSVWSLNMHNIITRGEFDQRMQEINSVVSQNPCPRPYIIYCFTFLFVIFVGGGSVLINKGFQRFHL
jgi:hypothetical protein